MKRWLLFLLLVCVGSVARGQLAEIGGLNRYDSRSLENRYGAGSRYKLDGLLNPYSRYGSRHGLESWRNPYSLRPPVLVRGGEIVGELRVGGLRRVYGGRLLVYPRR